MLNNQTNIDKLLIVLDEFYVTSIHYSTMVYLYVGLLLLYFVQTYVDEGSSRRVISVLNALQTNLQFQWCCSYLVVHCLFVITVYFIGTEYY